MFKFLPDSARFFSSYPLEQTSIYGLGMDWQSEGVGFTTNKPVRESLVSLG